MANRENATVPGAATPPTHACTYLIDHWLVGLGARKTPQRDKRDDIPCDTAASSYLLLQHQRQRGPNQCILRALHHHNRHSRASDCGKQTAAITGATAAVTQLSGRVSIGRAAATHWVVRHGNTCGGRTRWFESYPCCVRHAPICLSRTENEGGPSPYRLDQYFRGKLLENYNTVHRA